MPRFLRKGRARFYFVPTIASAALTPTAAEVNAGTRLDTQLAEVNGFQFSNNPISTPDYSTVFSPTIPGEETATDSSMTFYEDSASNPIQTVLARGVNGFIVSFYSGLAGSTPAAGDKADVWPVSVTHNTRQYTAANEAAQYQVGFAITAAPGENRTLT